MLAGTSRRPAALAQRRRRSPKMSSKRPPGRGRTRRFSRTPCWRMLSVRLWSSGLEPLGLRGRVFQVLGSIAAIGTGVRVSDSGPLDGASCCGGGSDGLSLLFFCAIARSLLVPGRGSGRRVPPGPRADRRGEPLGEAASARGKLPRFAGEARQGLFPLASSRLSATGLGASYRRSRGEPGARGGSLSCASVSCWCVIGNGRLAVGHPQRVTYCTFDGGAEAHGFAVRAGSSSATEQGSWVPRKAESLVEVGNGIGHGVSPLRTVGRAAPASGRLLRVLRRIDWRLAGGRPGEVSCEMALAGMVRRRSSWPACILGKAAMRQSLKMRFNSCRQFAVGAERCQDALVDAHGCEIDRDGDDAVGVVDRPELSVERCEQLAGAVEAIGASAIEGNSLLDELAQWIRRGLFVDKESEQPRAVVFEGFGCLGLRAKGASDRGGVFVEDAEDDAAGVVAHGQGLLFVAVASKVSRTEPRRGPDGVHAFSRRASGAHSSQRKISASLTCTITVAPSVSTSMLRAPGVTRDSCRGTAMCSQATVAMA